jgi:hypothetical protein
MPVYQMPKGGKRRTQSKVVSPPRSPTSKNPPSSSSTTQPGSTHTGSFSTFGGLLDPAVDGPPSPQRIRAIARQMQHKTSLADKHLSQQTISSGSSFRSRKSDTPSWEHGLEQLTLSRRSSQRSTTSSMPSRERPESVQIFGKTLFNRRGKLRRESSEFGSSSSSLHSAEMPTEAAPSKEQHLLSLARRKLSRSEDPEPKRKLQISGPYDFQHLTHTEKDHVSDLNRLHQMPQGRRPTLPTIDAFHVGAIHNLPQQDPSSGLRTQSVSVDRDQRQTLMGPPVPSRSMKRTQSQDQIRVPPPRPPRSPVQGSFTSPIPPPPRGSSRVSVVPDYRVQLGTINLDHPILGTTITMRRPSAFSVMPTTEEDETEPADDAHAASQCPPASVHRFSHAFTTPDDAAWPLAAEPAMSSLPDVPEEEENHLHHRSRISIASNSSSLRGSVSVPLLRQVSHTAPVIPRPPSNASETLGRFDLFAAQRALQSHSDEESVYDDEFAHETWEDDIDYVYDHAAEADCDYAWERPSLDFDRDDEDQLTQTVEVTAARYPSDGSGSYGMLSPPSQDDVPALSPVSQISNTTQNEIRTPTVSVVPANFSRPRRDSSAPLTRSHERNTSHAESFQEQHGCDIFPSSLIPNDYHHQVLLRERGELREEDEGYLFAPLSPSGTHFAKSAMTLQARSSASTTNSVLSKRSSSSSRHRSVASTSTTLTHWTTSSTLATIDACEPGCGEKEQAATSDSDKDSVAALPRFDEGRFPRERSRESHARTQSHTDLLFTKPLPEGAASVPSPEFVKTRRRAKTTSRSHNPPPVALGLFPSVTKGNCI